MARPTVVDIPDTDVDVDSPGSNDLFTRVRDNINGLRVALISWVFTNANTGATGWTDIATLPSGLWIPSLPDYTGIQRRARLNFVGINTGGTRAEFRLRDVAAGVNGPTVSTTLASPGEDLEATLDFAAGLVLTTRDVRLQAQIVGSGTARADCERRIAFELDY